MNCLLNVSRSCTMPLQSADSHQMTNFSSSWNPLRLMKGGDRHRTMGVKVTSGLASGVKIRGDRNQTMTIKVTSGSASSAELSGTDADVKEEKSEIYSNNMTEAMGAALTYRHEAGMNYDFILPDLIVGSCLQTPADVDKLREIGVKTIFCLQQNSDLEYFGVKIEEIREYAGTFDDIEHLRAEIRDFDAHDLRLRLPEVLSVLHKAVTRNGGVTYIHCTAGLGRAPAVALTYMFWFLDYKLRDAQDLLLCKRPCFPKMDAIRSATADILTGQRKLPINLSWKNGNCSTVEVSGLDIGWGQRIPLKFDEDQGTWNLERELYEGRYEYKYIVDGNWTCNEQEQVTSPNKDGHVNNYIEVAYENPDSTMSVRRKLFDEDADLTTEEREKIREFLDAISDANN